MNEPWFSEDASIFIAMLAGLPIFIFGVTSGFTENKTFQRYMIVISLISSIGAIIFGLVAMFLGQPSSVYFSFILAGAIVTVGGIGFWHALKQTS